MILFFSVNNRHPLKRSGTVMVMIVW